MKTLKELAIECHKNAVEHGFWDDVSPNVGEKIALIHSELSEMLESERTDDVHRDIHCPDFTNREIELADTFIRLLDYAAGFGYADTLEDAIKAKMLFNSTRPTKHGKRF